MNYSCVNRIRTLIRALQPNKVISCTISRHTSTMSTSSNYRECITKEYNDITKSQQDAREYRALLLKNDMKILLVSDPTTDKSSAAMDVNIGSMSDPREFPGLAHFCEHMLFLGTKKYPEENEYTKYLSEHAGSCNAFTSGEHTNYFFDVAPTALPDTLDRFSQFFVGPLFTASATEREVNAVNSEHDKNIQSDSWRMFQLERATSDPKHDYSKFGTGNKETLLLQPRERGEDPRDALLNFHKSYYSANLMGLCVLGKESLDELTELVVPKFCDVINSNVKVPEWLEHPFSPEQLKKEIHIVPVKDHRQLSVTWPMIDLHPFYKTNPGHYLGHLIGHEGSGSLLSELKGRGWVNTLLGGQKSGANGFMFFIVNVDLSEEGIKHVDDIITLIYQYLNMLRTEGPKQWVFTECQDLSNMGFRFKDKERPRNLTSSASGLLHDYPMEECLCGSYLLVDYKPELINTVLEKLIPDTMRIAVIAKQFEGEADLKEKWYGTEYSIAPISEEKLQNWGNAGLNDNLRLPDRNEFVPTNFDLRPRETEPNGLPIAIRDTDMTRVWYRQDDKFLLPKACINIEFTSPYAYMDPLCTNLTYMFVDLFKDDLNEYAYAAELGGLIYDLHCTIYGLTLGLRGYQDKQHILLQKVMEKMTTFRIDSQRFNILKEKYERGLKNFKAEQPHQHAMYYTSTLMSEQCWTKDELLDSLEEVTVPRLEAFVPQLLSRIYLEFLVYGNVDREVAYQLADIVENTLKDKMKTKPLLSSQQRRFRQVQLPDASCFLYQETNEVHKSSSLEVYYQCNMEQTDSNVLLELFCQIINEPCYDILRTQEQLGYIVFSGVRRSNGIQGLRVIVQSDRTPDYVEERVENFLHKMESYIAELSPERFGNHVEALANRRLEHPKKLSAQSSRYWSEIISQQYNFDRDTIEVKHLKTLTQDDVMAFYKELIAHDAPKRHKLSVHVLSTANDSTDNNSESKPPIVQVDGETPAPAMAKAEIITDATTFKKRLPLFPLPSPYINLGSPTLTSKSKL